MSYESIILSLKLIVLSGSGNVVIKSIIILSNPIFGDCAYLYLCLFLLSSLDSINLVGLILDQVLSDPFIVGFLFHFHCSFW